MRKFTKRSFFYIASLLVFTIVATLTLFYLSLKSNDSDRHQAVDALRKISGLDQLLRERILESHAFKLNNYDSLAQISSEIQSLCPAMKAIKNELLISAGSEMDFQLELYCQQTTEVLEAVEVFKSKNSMLRNSLNYFPAMISDFRSPAMKTQALELHGMILNYCVQPKISAETAMENALISFSKFATKTRSEQLTALNLEKHAKVVIQAASERQAMEAKIFSSPLRSTIAKITDNYVAAMDKKEHRSNVFKICILVFSALLLFALVALTYRLQVAAERLGESNRNLESKVSERTFELKTALSDLERQQEMVAHATKMSALGEMAGGIAHEINTPLAAISLSAETLLYTEPLSEDARDALSDIVKVVQKLTKIVLGLRKFSRHERVLVHSECKVDQIVDETLLLCAEKYRSFGVQLKVQTAPEMSVRCAPEQISQVIMNLLNNSFDAVTNLKEKWISIQYQTDAAKIRILISDSGQGIPEAVRAKIMQPFFTTKGVGKGTGIGLSISAGLIENHGGRLFYDESAHNTTFVIELPRNSVVEAA